MDSLPAPNKDFYTIYPKNGTDTSKTGDYITGIVGNDDLQPWTNLQQQLISWTVEASPNEAEQLRGYGDIESVGLFIPPKPPGNSSTSANLTMVTRAMNLDSDAQLSKGDQPPNEGVGYVVHPHDGSDKAATDQTDKNLKQLLGGDYQGPGIIINDQVAFWQIKNGE